MKGGEVFEIRLAMKSKGDYEKYIYWRKIKAFSGSLLFWMCRVFPLEPDKIVMWTLEGKGGYSDSPKYIAEEIIRRDRNRKRKYKIVWLTELPGQDFPEEIKTVKNSVWSRAYHLSTAGFWIGNTRTVYGTKKRRGTSYIQTWHSIAGIKPIGEQRGNRLPQMARIVSKSDSEMIDYVLSGNEWSCKMCPSGLIYNGPILKTGIPRCDVLFWGKDAMRKKCREKYGLSPEAQIILYAPTFRGGSQKGRRSVSAQIGTIDFDRLIHAVEAKFGGIWYVFLRLHPQVADQAEAVLGSNENDRVIDVSTYPDMNELIAAGDALITDYSSSVFESAVMKQPGFLFVEDEREYVKDRGKLMFELDDMPFPKACNMNELIAQIERFDIRAYQRSAENFMKELGCFEDGKASGRVVDLIEELTLRKAR